MNTQRVRMNTQRGVTSRWGIPPARSLIACYRRDARDPIAGKSLQYLHQPQGLPLYGEDATRKVAETDDFSPFWYRGTRDIFFIGWRILLQNASIRGATCLYSFEPLFKGRRKQGCKKTMARPEGAQALRAIQEALDGGRFLPVVNYILPR